MISPFECPAFVQQALTTPLLPSPLPSETILQGSPQCFQSPVLSGGGSAFECGIWELTPGIVSDVESNEIFLVLAGTARVDIQGAPSLNLAPGCMGVLRLGDRTVWHVSETLRKVYILFKQDDSLLNSTDLTGG